MTLTPNELDCSLRLGQSLMRVAESKTVDTLGEEASRFIADYVGSLAISIYALDGATPKLLFSKEVPEGLHVEYRDSKTKDLLLEYVATSGMPVHDQMMKGRPGWIDQGNLAFLRRWGFGHCMAGAIKVDGKIAAVIYIGRSEIYGSYSLEARAAMDLVCRASSHAYAALDIKAPMAEPPSPPPAEPANDRSEFQNVEVLPPRGRQVARLICQGRSNKEIARSLGISAHTVKEHLGTLYKKFSVSNRTELVGVLMKAS
ncbi:MULTISPECIES: response regulator transcription factor [Mesorhizobium]|nr:MULTISPECIES: helix-turn-helix transcriptional regulator [Mesorhizobium]MCV3210996.1 helix-turn-helix transcriptional regulator [Mesorhizobium sp. YC-2]